jgi:hypothetical protein
MGDAAMKRTDELLNSRFPGLETRSYVGSIGGSNRRLTGEDVKKISKECAAVIATTAD